MNRFTSLATAYIFLLLSVASPRAEAVRGKVVGIADGDTLTVFALAGCGKTRLHSGFARIQAYNAHIKPLVAIRNSLKNHFSVAC